MNQPARPLTLPCGAVLTNFLEYSRKLRPVVKIPLWSKP